MHQPLPAARQGRWNMQSAYSSLRSLLQHINTNTFRISLSTSFQFFFQLNSVCLPIWKLVHFYFSLSSHFLLFLSESPLFSFIRDLASRRKCRPLLVRIMTSAARWSFWRRREVWTKSHLAEPPASARIMKNVPCQVRERNFVCVLSCCSQTRHFHTYVQVWGPTIYSSAF